MKRVYNKQVRKKQMVSLLKDWPSIVVACKQIGLPRCTYYRWIKEDPQFSKDCQEQLIEGVFKIHGTAEWALLNGIKKGDWRAVTYWLSHRHEDYNSSVPCKR